MMNKLLMRTFIVVIVIITPTVFAQETILIKPLTSHQQRWSMEFGIESDLTFSAFEGTVISFSRIFPYFQKIRLGLSLDAHIQKEYYPYSITKDDFFSFNFVLQYLKYIEINNNTFLYCGVGPTFYDMYGRATHSYVHQSPRKFTMENFRIGLLGSLGIEYFLNNSISLHGEYGISAFYYRYREKWDEHDEKSTDSEDGWNLSGEDVLIGLSVYF